MPSISLTKDKTGQLKDLSDLILVERTINNARLALEIDEVVWASIISMMIVANIEVKVIGDPEASEKAIEHIETKTDEWKINQLFDETILRLFTDVEVFVRKYIDPENPFTIQSADILAYDEDTFDIMDISDWETGESMGYIQKAKVVKYPENWFEDIQMDFDRLKNLEETEEEFKFKPDQIVHLKLIESDKKGQSFIYKALDYVFIKKSIINMLPKLVRRAGMTLGIEIGNSDVDMLAGLYNPEDSPATKQAKVDTGIKAAADKFTKLIDQENITYPYGITPKMIGEGKLIDVKPIIEMLNNFIRTALLTPDSKFESDKGSKFTAEQQLTGGMGQTNVISYIRDKLLYYFEPGLIDNELSLAKFESDVGLIHWEFTGLDVEDEVAMSNIAQTLTNILQGKTDDPELFDLKVLINTYFKRFSISMQKNKQAQGTDNNKPVVTDEGVVEPTPKTVELVNALRNNLKEEGLIK